MVKEEYVIQEEIDGEWRCLSGGGYSTPMAAIETMERLLRYKRTHSRC